MLASVHRPLPSSSFRPSPCRSRLRVGSLPAEPAAAVAAEDPGPPLRPGRSRSTTPTRRLSHQRAARSAGQRVMRHFLHESTVLRRPVPLAFAIAPLALRMLVTTPAAVLIAAAGETLRFPARGQATLPGTVDMAAVAAPAENDPSTAGGAIEPAGGVTHRGGRRGRVGPAPSRPGRPLRENALMSGGGNGDRGDMRVLADTRTGPRKVLLNTRARRTLDGRPRRKPICVSLAAQPVAADRSPFSIWYRVRREAGIEDAYLHPLRHTHASHAAIIGVPVPVVSRLLSHSSTGMTPRSVHLGDRDIEAAAERVGEAIETHLEVSDASQRASFQHDGPGR